MESPTRNPSHWAYEHGDAAHETFDRYREFTLNELADDPFGVYVTCFCEEGDLLSQWRAYGSEHGYAVEINARAIQQAVRDLMLAPPTAGGVVSVRYGPDAAVAAATDAVAAVEEFNLNHPGVKAHYKALELATILATVKHPGFSEERDGAYSLASRPITYKVPAHRGRRISSNRNGFGSVHLDRPAA